MKKLIAVVACIFTIGICSNQAYGQYTLTNDDVEVVNGSIVKCTYNFSNQSIIIPDSLDGQKIIEIGSGAFQAKDGIPAIKGVTFSVGIEKIGNSAFAHNEIASVTFPSSLKSIGDNAFASNNITSLSIPANIQAIGESAFHDNNITTLTLNEGLIKIGPYAFNNNQITSLTIPNSVTDLGYCAFQINRISSLIIGSGTKHIGHRTFWKNELTTLVIPEGVVTLENGAFSSNKISNLTIPSSVVNMWEGPFNDNQITMVNGEPSNGIIYGRNQDGSINNTIIESYGGVADVIDFIPESVTHIGGNSFSFNGLTSVTIPATVKTIYTYAFSDNNISTLNLPDGLKRIEEMAFFNNKLTSLNLPASVNYLGGGCFNMNTITTLNGEATNGLFYARNYDGSERVTKVVSYAGSNKTIEASLFSTETDTIGQSAFLNSQLTSVELPTSISVIEGWAFERNLITSVVLPEGIKQIWNSAFNDNRLTSVSIPNSVTLLDQGAFQNNLLTSVNLPNTITDLKAWLFQNNKLTSINIPSSVTYIGDGAFAGNNLSSLTIPGSVTEIGSSAFSSNGLTSLNIPGNVEKIGNSCFTENQISSLTLNDGLKIIGDGAFHYNQITQPGLSIPTSVSSIGANAFAGNSSIDSLYLHQPTVSGFQKWVDGYGINQSINTWVSDLSTSYIADVELTLSDNDIVIENGYIQSVNYDIRANKITIPRVLQNQVVIGIRNNYWDHEKQADVGGVFEKRSIISLVLPTSLMHIGDMAFYENNLSEALIPDSARYIGRDAFSRNAEINSITLPNPANPNFIEWTDLDYNKYAGGTTVYTLNKAYRAQYKYTLTDDDVEMQNGAMISCSYNFEDKNIIIPEVLDGQKVISIREIWIKFDDGNIEPYGIFQNKKLNSIQLPATLDSIAYNSFAWNELKSVILPEGLKYLAHGAFHANKLDSVVLPDSITYIGEDAFSYNKFQTMNLPNLQSDLFVYWYNKDNKRYSGGDKVSNFSDSYTALYKYTLTDDDVEMKNGAIISCSYDFSSKYLIIPETLDGQEVISIKELWLENEYGMYMEGMFAHKELVAVDLPSTLDSIGENAFYGNKLTYIKIPDGVKYINNSAFVDNILDSIDMPVNIPSKRSVFNRNNLKKLNGKSFDGIFYKVKNDGTIDSTTIACYGGNSKIIDFIGDHVLHLDINSFSGINIEQVSMTTLNIETIGDFAFSGTQITEIELPNSVTYIGTGAFQEGSLQEFTLPTPPTEDFLYWYDQYDPKGIYQAGEVVTNLENSYTALIKYTLTDDDVVVENGAIVDHSYDYRSAFIEIPDTLDGQEVIAIREIMRQYEEDGETHDYMAGMFQPQDNGYLIGVILPGSIDSLCNNAFADNQIDTLFIPEGIEYFGHGCFQNNRITQVTLPKSTRFIGGWAFESNNFNQITLPNPTSSDFFYWIDRTMNKFDGGATITDLQRDYYAVAKYTLKDSDVEMQDNAIISTSLDYRFKYLVIPDTLDGQTVNAINSYVINDGNGSYKMGIFQGWDENVLLGLELPKTLKYVDVNTFHLNKLDSVTLPAGLMYIGSGAFQNSGLQSIVIPDSVQFIGYGAFVENNFNEIVLPNPDNDDFVFWYTSEMDRYEGGATTGDIWNEFTALYKYTLTDDDVVVENGSIVESMYDWHSLYIVIPNELDGQEVVNIAAIQNGDEYTGMFQGQENRQLLGVDLPSTLDTLGMFAFAWNNIISIELPNELVYIDGGALQGNWLSEITLPATVTYIGEFAFADNGGGLSGFALPDAPNNMEWKDGEGNTYDNGTWVENLHVDYFLDIIGAVNNNETTQTFVYPNPAINEINIANNSIKNTSVQIFNIAGELILSKNLTIGKIDINNLESGLYLMKIYDDKQKIIFDTKFVKQ